MFPRGVGEKRRTQIFQTVTPAQREELVAATDVIGVREAGMTRLEFERVRVGRLDHDLRIDPHAVFNDRRGVLHQRGLPQRTLLELIVAPATWAAKGIPF